MHYYVQLKTFAMTKLQNPFIKGSDKVRRDETLKHTLGHKDICERPSIARRRKTHRAKLYKSYYTKSILLNWRSQRKWLNKPRRTNSIPMHALTLHSQQARIMHSLRAVATSPTRDSSNFNSLEQCNMSWLVPLDGTWPSCNLDCLNGWLWFRQLLKVQRRTFATSTCGNLSKC